MLLIKICFLSCMILLCSADTTNFSQNLTKGEENDKVAIDENSFETAHKISSSPEEFQTSHKISNHPKAEYQTLENVDENDSSTLMQLQQTQNLLSTKERPELNPILSVLINEDVMKSIEAKRAIEQEQIDTVVGSEEAADLPHVSSTTEVLPIVLTTPKVTLFEDKLNEPNAGLVDQQINLYAAGSENNQKSHIQIKKGPNGMDYEYEYVYYYYDDDEGIGGGAGGTAKKQQEAESTLVQETSKRGAQPLERGKSRYTNIERSTTSAPDNALVSGKAKGRSSGPSATSNDVDEGRLPVITRFPSRGNSNSNEAHPTHSLENVQKSASEKSKKISVKHPSLELVDSETFNTDEKQTKGTPRNGDSEKTTLVVTGAASDAAPVAEPKTEEKITAESKMLDEVEQTTPLMEKAALDLYAILANENLELDMTTDLDTDLTTIIPTESDDDIMTTMEMEDETVIPTTPSTTTTSEPPPTTTTTTTTTTTSTTTTPAPSLFGAGRRGLAQPGRNRFRLKSSAAEPTTISTTEAPVTPAGEAQSSSSGVLKGRNRFQRPSFGNRKVSITPAPASSPEADEKEIVPKESDKPLESPQNRGRTRNRFSLRGQASSTTTTTGPDQKQNDEINQISSTTARSLRARPTLNIRGRTRIGARPSATTQAPALTDSDDVATPVSPAAEAGEEKPASTSSLQTRPSRFNINRAGAAGSPGANRLLPRTRVNALRTTSIKPSASLEPSDEASPDVKGEVDSESEAKTEVETTTAAGGLNKLKSRPRLLVQPKTDNKLKSSSPIVAARKPNPLLARRKLALGGSTTGRAVVGEEQNSEEAAEESPSEKIESDSSSSTTEEVRGEDNTELPETTTKQPRGLGLLTQRRRLPIRKPGTQL